VVVDAARAQGRGFIDGVASKQRGGAGGLGGLDWRNKRHLLNGALERIEAPLEKARRLLNECLDVESDYDPAHLYLAVIDRHEGKVLKAAKRLERVFNEAVDETCRGHAAGQLAKLYVAEEEYREALKYLRWGLQSGLVEQDSRFFFFRFNAALCFAHLRQPERSIGALRDALDHHPERAPELARALAGSPVLRACIDSQAGFPEALLQRCPELFAAAPNGEGATQ
jgi:tetratricopeptide (TPR) repeat protein